MHNTLLSLGAVPGLVQHMHTGRCVHTLTHMQMCTLAHMCTHVPLTHTHTAVFPSPEPDVGPRGSQVKRDITVQKKILNLISGLDSDEELGLLCHHTSYLGDCLGLFVGSPSSVTFLSVSLSARLHGYGSTEGRGRTG